MLLMVWLLAYLTLAVVMRLNNDLAVALTTEAGWYAPFDGFESPMVVDMTAFFLPSVWVAPAGVVVALVEVVALRAERRKLVLPVVCGLLHGLLAFGALWWRLSGPT
ncbi:MAG TPA: hypothetical protein VJU61_06070 [Polyangiaceae bacterium]|nr:hypothetical protein [Polyangiaceae bacterium]